MRLITTASAAALALTFGLASAAAAQDTGSPVQTGGQNSNVGTSAGEFMLLGAGARGMALRSGFSAIVRDVEALYYNPAGLPLMDGPQAMVTVMPYHADTDYMWGGFAFPFAGGQYAFGVSVGRFGFSGQPVYTAEDPTNERGLTYDVSETFIGLSFAHAFIDRFTGGVTVKYIADRLGATSASGVALDIGTNFHTEVGGKPISMAVSIQNLGMALQHRGTGLDLTSFPEPTAPNTPVVPVDESAAQFETHAFELPANFSVSLAYEPLAMQSGRLTVLGSFTERASAYPEFGFGGEYMWNPAESPVSAALRLSYTAQLDNSFSTAEDLEYSGRTTVDNVGMDGIVVGAGVSMDVLGYTTRVDYAWRHFGALGAVNVFSVGLRWQ